MHEIRDWDIQINNKSVEIELNPPKVKDKKNEQSMNGKTKKGLQYPYKRKHMNCHRTYERMQSRRKQSTKG